MAVTHKMASAETLELTLVGVVGDGWSDDPITKKAVRKALKEAPKAEVIKVHLDSFGGSYFEGLAIYQMLSEHPARVEMEIGACAASAASLIAMAGDEISLHETSTMLVHEVWTIAIGKAKDLRQQADDLDLLSNQAAIAYSSRTGMSQDDVVALMAEDRFMGADECKKLGFCTTIRKAKPKGKANQVALTESYVRSQIEQIKSDAEERLGSGRLAALAPEPSPTNSEPVASSSPTELTATSPEPSAPEPQPHAAVAPPQETQHMAGIIAVTILTALSLSANSTEDDAVSAISKLKADADAGKKLVGATKAKTADEALGIVAALQANAEQTDGDGYVKVMAALGASSPDEAIGTIEAFKAAKERLAEAEAKLADLTQQREQGERDEIVAKLEADGKCTPAQKKNLFPSLSLAGLKAFAATAVPVLKGDGLREPHGKGLASKKWDEMSAAEKRELRETNRAAYDAALAAHNQEHQA